MSEQEELAAEEGTMKLSAPKKYRKKPVIVEAVQLTDYDTATLAISWVNAHTPSPPLTAVAVGEGFEPHIISIFTLEGEMYADWNDWIIRGVKGEFYPCKPDIFEATYEAVEAP